MMSDSNFDFYDDAEENSDVKTKNGDEENGEEGKEDGKYEDSFSDGSDREDSRSRRSESPGRNDYDDSDEENNNDVSKNGNYSDDERHSSPRRSPSPANNGDITPRSDRDDSRRSSRHSSVRNGNDSRDDSRYSRYSSVESNVRSRDSSEEKVKAKAKKKPPIQNGVAKKNAQNKTSGRGRGRGKRPMPVSGRQDKNVVVDRVLSANRHKSRALHNVIHELQQQVDALTIENRDLQRVARLQEKEIRKLNDDEAQLPALLHKHNGDLRVKDGKIKKQKEELDKLRETVKRREVELRKCQDKLSKYEDLVKQKNLLEASELSKKVESLQKQLEDRDKRIADLSKSAQVKDKNTLRDLRATREKLKNTTEQCKMLEHENNNLKQKLRDKEKVLNSMNIYTIKNQKDPDRPLFTPTEPMPYLLRRHQEEEESQYAESLHSSVPPSEVSVASKSKPIVSHREKMEKKPHPKKAFATPSESPRTQPVKTMVGENQKQLSDHSDEDEDFYAGKKSEDDSRLEEIERKLAEINRKEEELKRKEEAEKEQARQEEELRKQREVEEQHRRKQEESQRKKREEEDARRFEEENKRRFEKEENERRRQEEENQRLLQEKERQEMESKKQEEDEKRKKRELLIARMNAIDQGEDPDKVEIPSPKQETPKKKKPIFLESGNSRENSATKKNDLVPNEPLDFSQPAYSRRSTEESLKGKPQGVSRRSTNESITKSERRNSWDFKPTDENLHRGLPSHSGINNDSPKLSRRNTQDSIGSGKSSGRHGKNRRAVLMDEDLDTTYSPSSLNTSPAPSANAGASTKKTGKSPFDQFEDPFGLEKPKKKKEKSKLVFSSDEDDDLDEPSYQPSKPPVKKGPVVKNNRANIQLSDQEDDLEEMTLG